MFFALNPRTPANRGSVLIWPRPYILSRINWKDPLNDPVFCQFIPTKSRMEPDHPKLTLDSLHEIEDSPVKGLVHRYPDKALFLRKILPDLKCAVAFE